ncbi:MAG TPA: NapC/NirT family cytochrome c [Anaeromyxobacter sp.]|nr:NapC/NirT family cytochrome c [Anaeromyxobacter sp.]
MGEFFRQIIRTRLGLIGAVLTTASGFLVVAFFVLSLAGIEQAPYLGVLAYLLLPAVFALGLLFIPLGMWWERRRLRRTGSQQPLPILDLNERSIRGRLRTFAFLSAANVIILAGASWKGVEVMDRPAFCGSCHKVMDPEFTVYSRSPHSRVACVQCHIGPGASWFVRSKLSGAWQVVSVTFNLYPRPIPTPVRNLRPSRDTCEQCHWPTKFVGDRLEVITHFADDEKSTPKKTVLLLHVGGGEMGHGIHHHVSQGVSIRYLSDAKRERIQVVELTRPDGSVQRFEAKPDAKNPAPEPSLLAWRTMDCVDCHNRPTHQYRAAEDEVDAALADGRIDRTLPFAKKQALAALTAPYSSREAALEGIRAALAGFYEKQYPEVWASKQEAVLAASRELAAAWGRNVWPGMRITWGTYPTLLGHKQTAGCWRCHDENHATADGKTISQDCDTCHATLAEEEESPAILKQLGLGP